MLEKMNSIQKLAITFLIVIFAGITGQAQQILRHQPVWWFGGAAAANLNYYRGNTQMLNKEVTTPTAFHKGNGVKPYLSLLTEYRPGKVWGGMLNLAYDNRGSEFKDVMAPCDCPATLSTNLSYLAVEPAVRVAPFASSFYLFAGPVIGFNVANSFSYTQEKQTDKHANWSDIRNAVLSAQAGAGMDIYVSSSGNATQMTVSPFASFQSDFGRNPRTVESWSVYTIRVGVAVKFGRAGKPAVAAVAVVTVPALIPETSVSFSVRAPKEVPVRRKVKETFALRNSVFFDMGSTEIPGRYVHLSKNEANSFREAQLQAAQPENLSQGRAARQMAVYHNILNIIGDRMRENIGSTITLSGASNDDPAEGLKLAETVQKYLVNSFGINPARITVEGRDKPVIPSEQPGATRELALLREGDRRVDIVTTSPALLLQVGGSTSPFLKPIEIIAVLEDPLDSHLIFNVAGADTLLSSWNIQVTDKMGNMQHYGPYTKNQASVSGKTILGDSREGEYKIVMTGQRKSGIAVTQETSVRMVKRDDPKQEGLRYSILFDFDKSKGIASYEKFLTEVVTPLIPENGSVIIHGHTDIIGDEKHNHSLSYERAVGVQQIIESAILKAGKKGIKFETFGFGKDATVAPFENVLPEERFYNRTVIIDIVNND
jgi:outer membrane protein OmpA-like peptidoglycan-associated protein